MILTLGQGGRFNVCCSTRSGAFPLPWFSAPEAGWAAHDMVIGYLSEHPDEDLSPTGIGRSLARSSGASVGSDGDAMTERRHLSWARVRLAVLESSVLAVACLIAFLLATNLLSHAYFLSRADDLLGGMWAVIAAVFVCGTATSEAWLPPCRAWRPHQ